MGDRRPRSVNRLISETGLPDVVRLGCQRALWRDAYHRLLTAPWPKFLIWLSLVYLGINAVFALLYSLDLKGIANTQPDSYADAFFFSVQTLATIGYGSLYPKSAYVHVLVTLESLVGMLWMAMATGLMFARFSRPTARVMFSRYAVIAPWEGQPMLMFRVANERNNNILQAKMQVTLVRNEQTREGELVRRLHSLSLLRSESSVFTLTWTAYHPINEASPLFGHSLKDLQTHDALIVVTLVGLDDGFTQTVHARYTYSPAEVYWQHRLADIITSLPDGRRAIDYSRFHDIYPCGDRPPLTPGSTSQPTRADC